MPMAATNFDPLREFKEGVKIDGRPVPLGQTKIDVSIRNGFATVKTIRSFKNDEDRSIEATMTYPVPVDAVMHGLKLDVDGRQMIALAKETETARADYEAAVDAGKTAVLHEEKLRGVHVLSVTHIPPSKEVSVEVSWSTPLSLVGDVPSLKIPTTVAEIYGRLPLLPVDDLITHPTRVFAADLSISLDQGIAHVVGHAYEAGKTLTVSLDRPIIVHVTGGSSGALQGLSADGRNVEVTLAKATAGERALRLGIVFDRSCSTADPFSGESGKFIKVWDASHRALKAAVAGCISDRDQVSVWQFDDSVQFLGRATGGSDAAALVATIAKPHGGTEIGLAIGQALSSENIDDVVLITDGRSGALSAHQLAACGKRVSAVLCGRNSLEATVGHLVSLTGGQIIVVGSDNIEDAILTVIGLARLPKESAAVRSEALPTSLSVIRGGTAIDIKWHGDTKAASVCDEIGAFAAALALPTLEASVATSVAVSHGLCTHLTSLIVVDEAGVKQDGLPSLRKVPLSAPVEAMAFASFAPQAAAPASAMAPSKSGFSALRLMASGGNDLKSADTSWTAGRSLRSIPVSPGVSFFDRSRIEAPADVKSSFNLPVWKASVHGLSAMTIDWDASANEFLDGDLSSLSVQDKARIEIAATVKEVTDLAATLGRPAIVVVLSLVAMTVVQSRGAARLARAVFGGADEVKISSAKTALML